MSKKNVPAIVSAMGVFIEIIFSLVKFVKEFGGTMEDIYRLATQEGTEILKEAARVIVNGAIKKWREENGIIYFLVTTNGMSGSDWILYLERKGFRLSDYAKNILRSPDFQPSQAGETIEIAVLKGELFSDNNRTTKNIRKEAGKRGFNKPNAEVACLIREKFSDKELEEMGLYWIVAMHEPIKDSGGAPRLLYAYRIDDGSWLNAFYDHPDYQWYRSRGFAFVVSQVCP